MGEMDTLGSKVLGPAGLNLSRAQVDEASGTYIGTRGGLWLHVGWAQKVLPLACWAKAPLPCRKMGSVQSVAAQGRHWVRREKG